MFTPVLPRHPTVFGGDSPTEFNRVREGLSNSGGPLVRFFLLPFNAKPTQSAVRTVIVGRRRALHTMRNECDCCNYSRLWRSNEMKLFLCQAVMP